MLLPFLGTTELSRVLQGFCRSVLSVLDKGFRLLSWPHDRRALEGADHNKKSSTGIDPGPRMSESLDLETTKRRLALNPTPH